MEENPLYASAPNATAQEIARSIDDVRAFRKVRKNPRISCLPNPQRDNMRKQQHLNDQLNMESEEDLHEQGNELTDAAEQRGRQMDIVKPGAEEEEMSAVENHENDTSGESSPLSEPPAKRLKIFTPDPSQTRYSVQSSCKSPRNRRVCKAPDRLIEKANYHCKSRR